MVRITSKAKHRYPYRLPSSWQLLTIFKHKKYLMQQWLKETINELQDIKQQLKNK